MILFIHPYNKHKYINILNESFRLRKRIFVDKLGWDLKCQDNMEIDQYDTEAAHYLIYLDEHKQVKGCMRLIPTVSKNLTQDSFAKYVPAQILKRDPHIWESSRFCLETPVGLISSRNSIREGTYEIYAAMIEFCLENEVNKLIFVASKPIERLLSKIGLQYQKLSPDFKTDDGKAFIGEIKSNYDQFISLVYDGELNPFYQLSSSKDNNLLTKERIYA